MYFCRPRVRVDQTQHLFAWVSARVQRSSLSQTNIAAFDHDKESYCFDTDVINFAPRFVLPGGLSTATRLGESTVSG